MADRDQDILVVAVDGSSISQEPPGIFGRALSTLDRDIHPGDGAFNFLRFGSHRILPDES